MTSNNETISRLKSSSGEHLNFFRKVSSFIGYWRSHDIWQWHHFPASLQASNISKSVQSHWLPRGHTKSNIRLSTVYEIKIFKWWVFDSGLSSKRLRNWWSSVWFVKVVHISVTGDTLFEELLVSKPNETKKKKDLLNRKRSLIVVICYAINLGVRSFSLPVYTLNAVLMQRFATEVNSFIHLTCALISYFVFRNGEIRVMNTRIWISKILSACL